MRLRAMSMVMVLLLAGCSEESLAAPDRSPTVTTTSTTTTIPQATTTTTAPPPPEGVDADSWCLERAVFGDPGESLYILPFREGEEYYVTQSYCFSMGGHAEQLAYDFDMPVGRSVIAARAGTVRDVVEHFPDTGEGYGEHNYVMVEHEDGTLAFYAHLHRDGVLVDRGDSVATGQVIAISGNSGLTGSPHLHFGVYRSWPPYEGFDVPVNFRNAQGPLDSRAGLMLHRHYLALPDPGLTASGVP
jgi:murein DD-endopeptidase MepM/ murein hydrolase activator NlpD